jgi:hypothetical protein
MSGEGQNLLSVSRLFEQQGIVTYLEPKPHLLLPDKREVPLVKDNGLYLLHVHMRAPSRRAFQAGAVNARQLHAARFHASGRSLDGLLSAQGLARQGTTSPAVDELIDKDKFRASAMAKRAPARPISSGARREVDPGGRFIIDALGPMAVADVASGHRYLLVAVDEATDFMITLPCVSLTHATWLKFLEQVHAYTTSHGRVMRFVRHDTDPVLSSERFKQDLASNFNAVAEQAPAGRHEGVGRAEAANDVLTNWSEVMLQRASKTGGFTLLAMRYATFLRNRTNRRGHATTRMHEFTSRPASMLPEPFLFGTEVSYLLEEGARGGKSSNAGCSAIGVFVGISSSNLLILAPSGNLVTRPHVTALN